MKLSSFPLGQTCGLHPKLWMPVFLAGLFPEEDSHVLGPPHRQWTELPQRRGFQKRVRNPSWLLIRCLVQHYQELFFPFKGCFGRFEVETLLSSEKPVPLGLAQANCLESPSPAPSHPQIQRRCEPARNPFSLFLTGQRVGFPVLQSLAPGSIPSLCCYQVYPYFLPSEHSKLYGHRHQVASLPQILSCWIDEELTFPILRSLRKNSCSFDEQFQHTRGMPGKGTLAGPGRIGKPILFPNNPGTTHQHSLAKDSRRRPANQSPGERITAWFRGIDLHGHQTLRLALLTCSKFHGAKSIKAP